MRNGLFLVLIAIGIASLALPQATRPASSPNKASTKKTATKKTTFSSTRTAKKSTKGTAKTAAASHSRQMTPTPERYKEIQQALADKGYLKSEPNGTWDAQSVAALRQFQTDQKLSVTGRISSASLIGLGLGPNTATPETPAIPATSPTAPPTVPAPASPSTPEN